MASVMLVDDSATIRMSIEAVLSKNGYTVNTAVDGQDALRKLGTSTPDVIITDLNMPQLNGMDFIRQARALPNIRFTPILFLTNESEQRQREAAKAAGATGWIVKPVKPDALLDILRSVLPK